MTPHTLVATLTAIMYALRGGRGNVDRMIDEAVNIADKVLDRNLNHLTRRPAGVPVPEPDEAPERPDIDWSEGFEDTSDEDDPEDI